MLACQGADLAIGYVGPPVEVVARGDVVTVRALNARGRILLPALARATADVPSHRTVSAGEITVVVAVETTVRPGEDSTRPAGVFAALRAIVAAMRVTTPGLGCMAPMVMSSP
jgi:anthranilate synthase